MKAALVLAGGAAGVDGAKAKAWGLQRLFWEARDPQCTAKLLKDTRAAGIGVGLMRDPSWTNASADELAHLMHQDLTDHGFGATTGPDSCAAMFDIEIHSAQYMLTLLKSWRTLRSTRTTLWTLESFQAGWFTDELSVAIDADPNLIVVPQFYLGSPRMYPVDSAASLENLDHEISRARLAGFYSAEQKIPYGWNGIAYDFALLPSKPETAL